MKKTLTRIILSSIVVFTAGSVFAYTQTYRAADNTDIQLTVSAREVYAFDEPVEVQLSFVDQRTGEKPTDLGVVMAVDNGSARTVIQPQSDRTNVIVSAGVLDPGTRILKFSIPDGCGNFYSYSRFGVRTLFDRQTDCEFEHRITVRSNTAISGCTDRNATNYNARATVNDGSCSYEPGVGGCTDSDAANYNANATIDNGSCLYGLGDPRDPGDLGAVSGCTNPAATNYNAQATNNDGSCRFNAEPGCTDPVARNYNPQATIDNGSCISYNYGCTDRRAENFDASSDANDGSCIYPPGVSDSDFECSVNNQTWFDCEGRTFTLRTDETPIFVRTEPSNTGTWSDWCTGEIGNGVQAIFTELTGNGDNARVNFTFDRPGSIFDMVLCLNPDSNVRAQSHKNIKLKVIDMQFIEN